MTGPFDLLLDRPLDGAWFEALLFLTFALHLLLVLLAVGTAILGAFGSLRGEAPDRLPRRLLDEFFAHKSLAIVLGVAPLLLVFMGRSVPFLTAARLLAPLWMLVVPLLVVSLVLLEVAAHRARTGGRAAVWAVAGTAVLLAVPAAFAALVVAAENPGAWFDIFAAGGRLTPALGLHWLVRTLHLAFASVVVAGVWHGLRAAGEARRRLLLWAAAGTAAQVVLGVALLGTLPALPDTVGWTVLAVSVAGVAWLGWLLAVPGAGVRAVPVAVAAMVVVAGMLMTRQLLQDRKLLPLEAGLREAAGERRAQLGESLTGQSAWVEVADPTSIFLRSCAFCHGVVGNGAGDAAGRLEVPPEDLTGLVVGDRELRRILHTGVPGTAMPRFGFYTGDELDGAVAFLRAEIGVRRDPGEDEPPSSEARALFAARCGACHSPAGPPTELAAGFVVPPPDLSVLTVTPARGAEVLAEGYPGTMMRSFSSLSEADRLQLVGVVREIYRGSEPGAPPAR